MYFYTYSMYLTEHKRYKCNEIL